MGRNLSHSSLFSLNGDVNSLEKAAIGRRVSETEIDLVDLLFLGGK